MDRVPPLQTASITQDSIIALASGPVPAGVAVLRISGPAAGPVLRGLTGRDLPAARKMALRTIRDPGTEELLDQGLVVFFPRPGSFTGEDVAELHLHGGPAIVSGVLNAAIRASAATGLRCRLAGPGEFTRRAFDNGRLDLAAAEGISDLVRAETAAQRRQALSAASGAANTLFSGWRAKLQSALALIEASIDFADEDLPDGLQAEAAGHVQSVLAGVNETLAKADAGIRLRQGYLIAIVGPPNAGKSSLLNALAGREAAIVSSIPGTTRDIVEVSMDLGGYPVTLADTAGLREASDTIEAEGVRRARGLVERADLTLLVLDSADWPDIPDGLAETATHDGAIVWSKTDLREPDLSACHDSRQIAISAKTGAGIDKLLGHLLDRIRQDLSNGEAAVVTRQRHREGLEAVRSMLAEWSGDLEPEIQAHLIHQANRGMSKILGHSDIEDVLDLIFQEFCIGK